MFCTSDIIETAGTINPGEMPELAGLDYGSMLLKMVVALGIVLALSYVVLKLMQKYYGSRLLNKSNRLITGIKEVYRIDRRNYFGIIGVCGNYYLFTRGEEGIGNLKILDREEVEKYLGENDE